MSDVAFDYDGSRATARARLEADLPPDQLIPGGLSDLVEAASSAGAIATQLATTRRAIRSIDLSEKDWGGEASFSFFHVQDDDLRLFGRATGSFDDAEKALSDYIRELEAGRRTAEQARESYRRGKHAQQAAARHDHRHGLVEVLGFVFDAGDDPFHLEDAVTTLVSAMHDVFCAAQKAADALWRAAENAPTEHYLMEHHGPPASLKTLATIPRDLIVGVFNDAVGFGKGTAGLVNGARLMAWGKLTGDRDDYYYGLFTMEDGGKEAAKNGALLALDGLGPGELAVVKEMLRAPLDSTLRRTLRDVVTESRPRPSVLPCRDPVDPATGAVFVDQVDVQLPGVLPLILRRHYSSDGSHGQWFGRSWASTLDERVDVSERYAAVAFGDGMVLTYPLPEVGATALPLLGAPWPLERTSDERLHVTDPESGQVRHFARVRPDRFVLIGITEPNGHGVLVVRAPDGTPREVRHTGGYRVRVDTDRTIAGGRVTGLTVTAEDGSDPVRVATYSYDEGRLTGVTNSSGVPLEFGYDDAGRLVRWTDRTGVTFDYAYDDLGRCVRQRLRGGDYAARFGYRDLPDAHTETTVIDSRGERWIYVADERGLVVSETDPLGRTTLSAWDDAGRLTARTDPLGHTTSWLHDDRSVTTVRADGAVERTEVGLVAGRRLPVRTTLPDATSWSRTYDDRGNCLTVTDPLGATTTADYDEHGHLLAVTDALGGRREVRCDGAGLPISLTEPGGATTRLERDTFGRVTTIVDPLGARTLLHWTPEGHLAARTLADGSVERWTYDGEGNPVEHVDTAGHLTRLGYTAFDLLASVTAPDGSVTRFDYDSELRLASVTGAGGDEWRYVYDGAGQLVAETDYNGRTLGYEYDAAGRLRRRVNGAGEEVHYVRDVLGQVVSKRTLSTGGETATVFEHDPLGRLTRATSPDADLILERDPVGRVVAESVNGRGVTSSYDLVGRRTRRVTPTGIVTEWSHRPDGLPTSVTLAGREIGLDHDLAGRLTRRTLGGGTTIEQEYDAVGRLLGQRVGSVQERRYTYAPGGRLVGVEDRLGGTRRFEFDLADRITRVSGDLDLAELYSYDPLGNILRATLPGAGDAERREHAGTLLTRAGCTRYAYDRQGRLVRRTHTRLSRKPETWSYSWDAEDRLTSVRTPDGTTWRYLYDALGRRIAKQRLGDTGDVVEEVLFTWDGPTLVEESSASGARSWAHDGLSPFAQVERPSDLSQGEVDARFYAIVTDLVGSPTEMMDETGALLWHARRSLWGAPLDDAPEPVPLRFPGQYADPESGLFYNLHRYYDPTTGRYLSQDPLGLAPAPNPNTYVANPTVLCDPLGLAPCVPGGPGGLGHSQIHQYPSTGPRKSQFFDDVDRRKLSEVSGLTGHVQGNGNLRYVIRSAEDIGVDRTSGLPTDIYTVITKPDGTIVTMFPGTSARS